MILCLDVGNTQIHGGVYKHDKLVFQFRKTSRQIFSSDEIGIFFKNVLRENSIDSEEIEAISICSVVPEVMHSLRAGCLKYFNLEPFILKPGVKTGLKIKYRNPLEVGSDRIANAIAGLKIFPRKNIIIIDFGTATTFDVITKEKEYLGGTILPGIRISLEALAANTAQLRNVEVVQTKNVVGRSTVESIQSGIFFGQIGMVKELKTKIAVESFNGQDYFCIGTGGFSSLFNNANLFNLINQTLVLEGLYEAYKMNLK
ncbi:MAG: type III pantothenate kinase [Ignavibacteria bacterium]|jgi:type III pantothenate kinase